MQLGSASVDSQMQDIEREAMDMQLQDKLADYKRQMGLLPEGTGAPRPESLPAASVVEEEEGRPMLRGLSGNKE
jgi:hypothetical protein